MQLSSRSAGGLAFPLARVATGLGLGGVLGVVGGLVGAGGATEVLLGAGGGIEEVLGESSSAAAGVWGGGEVPGGSVLVLSCSTSHSSSSRFRFKGRKVESVSVNAASPILSTCMSGPEPRACSRSGRAPLLPVDRSHLKVIVSESVLISCCLSGYSC